jgi:hypothetical protein
MLQKTPSRYKPKRKVTGIIGKSKNYIPSSHGEHVAVKLRPTEDQLLAAHHRNNAYRSITSWVCGDPAPGESALDKREGR